MQYSPKMRLYYFFPLLFAVPFFVFRQMNLLPFQWSVDSNLTFAVDTLISNGGGTPAHLFHPDIATLWFEKFFIFPLAKFLKFISISTIQEFQASSNPYLNFADVSGFLLSLRLMYLYFACSFIYIALLKLFEPILEGFSSLSRIFMIAFFAVFSFYYIAPYHIITSNLIRYEQPAIMWAALSFLMMVYAAQTQKKRYIMLMGLFSGMAFLSKIIVIPSLILYLFLYCILNTHFQSTVASSTQKERKQTLILSFLLNIMVAISVTFALLSIFVWKTAQQTSQWQNLEYNLIFFTGAPFIAAVLIILAGSLVLYKKGESWGALSYYWHRLVLFLNFLYVPLILQLFQSQGVKLFSIGYIFSFGMGQIAMSMTSGYNNSAERIRSNITTLELMALVLLLAVSAVALGYLLKNKKTKLLALALSFTSIPFILLLNKIFLRDNGNEVELGFYTLFIACAVFLFLLYQQSKQKLLLLIPMILGICFQSVNLVKKLRLYNHAPMETATAYYRFNPKDWYNSEGGPFGYSNADGILYTKTLREKYNLTDNWEKASYWARDIKKTKYLLYSVAGNPNTLQDSAVSFKDSVLPHYNETLYAVSPEISSGLVLPIINDGALGIRADYAFYIITEAPLSEELAAPLELTDLKFNDYLVYKTVKPENYIIKKESSIKYILIDDYLAKKL